MKLTDLLALAKLGYTADDVKGFISDNSEETENGYKEEIENIKNESDTKDKTIADVNKALEDAKAEIESLKKQITEIQETNTNHDTSGSNTEVDNIERLKEFFRGGEL